MIDEWVALGVAIICIGIALYIINSARHKPHKQNKHHAVIPTQCHWCHLPVLVSRATYDNMLQNNKHVLCDRCVKLHKLNVNPRG